MSVKDRPMLQAKEETGWRFLNRRRDLHGFSLLEIMIVVAIIAMLVGLVTVVAGRLRGTAEKTSTLNLMSTMEAGLERFKADIGYYPPLLTDNLTIPDAENRREHFGDRRRQRYYSTLSLVPYLVGVGDLNRSMGSPRDEAKDIYDDGHAGDGFRNPGPDKSWGGSLDATERATYLGDLEDKQGGLKGRVYGPYIELGSQYDISPAVDRNGDPIEGVYQFNDWWGQPIRYYRGWQKDPLWDTNEEPPNEWMPSFPADQWENVMMSMRSAPYVLFSEGKDMQSESDREADDYEKVNKDNIVEVGS